MSIKNGYIRSHKLRGSYPEKASGIGYAAFESGGGWTDYVIDESLVYSHRVNEYTRKSFTEGLHMHSYYELIVYVKGDVEYIADDCIVSPHPYSVVWFSPGQMHTATLLSASEYERFVFYFSEDFFRLGGAVVPMTDFIKSRSINAFNPNDTHIGKIRSLLGSIDAQLGSKSPQSGLMAKAMITELFGIFNKPDIGSASRLDTADTFIEIKNYIDENYASLTVSDIAERFHYSREHLSRRFKDRFNIPLSEYIAKRRVAESLPLLGKMLCADVAYAVGFGSQSAYIAAFRKNLGCLPSEYKKML